MKTEIKYFDFKYWDDFVSLINNHWKKNHPIINRELFEWQYTGFGKSKGADKSKILLINDELVGFRGVIPGEYKVKKGVYIGCSFAIWIIAKNYRGLGLGKKMLSEIQKDFSVVLTLGSNLNTSVPIYQKTNYSHFDSLYRYVIPLELHGYCELLSENNDIMAVESSIFKPHLTHLSNPIVPNAKELAALWLRITNRMEIFSLNKTDEFWNWRYINNVGYKYLFFGDSQTGYIIGRKEKVLHEGLSCIYVLRIIEIMPSNVNTWFNESDQDFVDLIASVLNWARFNGCCCADFHISTKRFEKLMIDTGFMLQDNNYGPPVASLAGMFQPLVYKPNLVNVHWLILDNDSNSIDVNQDITHFVKSDGDRDRTNFWPIIE